MQVTTTGTQSLFQNPNTSHSMLGISRKLLHNIYDPDCSLRFSYLIFLGNLHNPLHENYKLNHLRLLLYSNELFDSIILPSLMALVLKLTWGFANATTPQRPTASTPKRPNASTTQPLNATPEIMPRQDMTMNNTTTTIIKQPAPTLLCEVKSIILS